MHFTKLAASNRLGWRSRLYKLTARSSFYPSKTFGGVKCAGLLEFLSSPLPWP
jgi:hypothetical protein